jgi:guanylate cyclase soluble subunit beta
MIHKAAEDFVRVHNGPAAWDEIIAATELTDAHFISGRWYEDDVTVKILVTTAEVLGVSVEDAMEAFGRHWVVFAGSSAYKPIFDMAGDSLDVFMTNLDRMHDSIRATMPEARMPSFHLLSASETELIVLYQSDRLAGLAGPLTHFVTGLLDGLLAHFDEAGEITSVPADNGVTFTIRRAAASAAA